MSDTSLSRLSRAMRGRANGFTIVELLAILGVVLVLLGVLIPALAGARDRARVTACLYRLNQHGFLIAGYAGDFRDAYPYGLARGLRHPHNGTVLDAPPGELWSYEWASALWHNAMIPAFYDGNYVNSALVCSADLELKHAVSDHPAMRDGPIAPLSYALSMACFMSPEALEARNPKWGESWFRVQRTVDVAFPSHKAVGYEPRPVHDGRARTVRGGELHGGPPWQLSVLAADGSSAVRDTGACVGGVVFETRLSAQFPAFVSLEGCLRYTPDGVRGVDWH